MNKRIVVHIGPPKTGTSAIQNWFSANQVTLKKNGIMYPEHDVDENGISSGNLGSICSIVPPAEVGQPASIEIDDDKLYSLLERFRISNYTVLFLSSEFFIQKMKILKEKVPNVELLAYLRNPFEILESNYNQGVKRSGFTFSFDQNPSRGFPHLGFFIEYAEIFKTESLRIRHYSTIKHYGHSLITDVLLQLGVNCDVEPTIVNNSYNFEALEFKRWLNRYKTSRITDSKIDNCLQAFNLGISSFTLIHPSLVEKYKNDFFKECEALKLLGLIDSLFLSELIQPKSARYLKQYLTKEQFFKAISFVKCKNEDLYFSIYSTVKSAEHFGNHIYDIWLDQFNSGQDPYLFDSLSSDSIVNFRNLMQIPDQIEDADVLRELAILAYSSGSLEFAVRLITKAAELRPHGKHIIYLAKEYTKELEGF